jgi:hypothetical protein
MMLAEIMADLAKKHKKGKIDIALIEVGSVLKKSKTFKNRMIRSINEILAKYKMDGKVRFISTRPRNATALGASVFTAMQKEKT